MCDGIMEFMGQWVEMESLMNWLIDFYISCSHADLLFWQTAQTVLVVVVVFCLSWLPHHVVHLWVEFGNFPLNQASFVFRVTAHCLAYSNSSVNPIIYAFLSENFRKAYKQVFRCQITSESPLNNIKEIRSKVDTPPSTNCTNVWLLGWGCGHLGVHIEGLWLIWLADIPVVWPLIAFKKWTSVYWLNIYSSSMFALQHVCMVWKSSLSCIHMIYA